ncbi:RING-H2 finger protein ATL56-like protein [Carex littledalei]|uniref:RING-H2 finger protein ATL56-like protein n=1 Tax=Carex littledalei TaxID=544730 RepID=A0A833QZH7_9POAL|nr:RING-H2 finger protein ATL56-like protein [Carex littledalei]
MSTYPISLKISHRQFTVMASPLQPPPDLLPSPPPCQPKVKPKTSDSVSSGERILSFVIRAIVMATAISLFFLFASVAAILLLHLWLAGAALRRHRNPNTNLNPNPISIPNPLDLTPALSPAQLRRIPCCIWRWPWPKEQCCAVCLEKVQRGEKYRSLPACAHVFHKACVDKWLLRCPKCPLCREVVRPVG